MTAPARLTFAEYVALDAVGAVKHEFLGGAARAMAGGSPEHAGIAANVAALLSNGLRGKPCRVFSSELRVRVPETGLATYPDATVVCGGLLLDPEDPQRQAVTNPRVVVEVLSPSTEAYDRGEKLAHYKRLESLGAVVLVAQSPRQVEVWSRGEAAVWTLDVARGDESALVSPLGLALPVAEIYRDPLSTAAP